MIALLTDFGGGGLYAGVLRAVIAAAAPGIPVIDITHDIAPHDIASGSFALVRAFEYIPAGSVIVAVVDPGVGSERRRIAVLIDGKIVICPDNGLLSDTIRRFSMQDAVILDRTDVLPVSSSATFEGRDLFGPIAALLARGAKLSEVGRTISDRERTTILRSIVPEPSITSDGVTGNIREIDTFGNIVTDIRRGLLRQTGPSLAISIGAFPVRIAPFVRTYADVAIGDICFVEGSFGYLEMAVRDGSASRLYAGLQLLERVSVRSAYAEEL